MIPPLAACGSDSLWPLLIPLSLLLWIGFWLWYVSRHRSCALCGQEHDIREHAGK